MEDRAGQVGAVDGDGAELALGEVEDPARLVHEHQPDGDQAVDGPAGDAQNQHAAELAEGDGDHGGQKPLTKVAMVLKESEAQSACTAWTCEPPRWFRAL